MPFFVCLFSSFISDVEQRTGVSENSSFSEQQNKKALLFFEFLKQAVLEEETVSRTACFKNSKKRSQAFRNKIY